MRSLRCGLKCRTRALKDTFKSFRVQGAWGLWADARRPDPRWRKIRLLHEFFSSAIKYSTAWTKRQIRKARAEHLDGMAARLGNRPLHEVQIELRHLGLGAKRLKKPGFALPDLCDIKGAPAIGRCGLDKAWLQYFNDMECGTMVH